MCRSFRFVRCWILFFGKFSKLILKPNFILFGTKFMPKFANSYKNGAFSPSLCDFKIMVYYEKIYRRHKKIL